MLLKFMIFTFCVFAGLASQAKTLVISDIDDTLKNAHVLDWEDAAKKAIFTDDAFLGMNGALAELASVDSVVQFHYVSSAPSDIMLGFHAAFIEQHRFPEGDLYLNDGYFAGDFKLRTIRSILRREKPSLAIFLGDNSEKDVMVYRQIQSEFPQIHFLTFIHLAYSIKSSSAASSIAPGQYGFVTSWDFLLQLYQKNLIPDDRLLSFFKAFAPVYLSEQEKKQRPGMAIPAWQDCRDFKWPGNDSLFVGSTAYGRVKQKIQMRCSRRAYTDD